jgi:hypothetical protein
MKDEREKGKAEKRRQEAEEAAHAEDQRTGERQKKKKGTWMGRMGGMKAGWSR